MKDLCSNCRKLKELVAQVSETSIGYCADCIEWRPLDPEEQGLLFLLMTIPFAVDDVVECRTGGQLYDGIGVVEEISFDLKNGGTPVCPAFRVRLIEKAYDLDPDVMYYTECCLTKVKSSVQN